MLLSICMVKQRQLVGCLDHSGTVVVYPSCDCFVTNKDHVFGTSHYLNIAVCMLSNNSRLGQKDFPVHLCKNHSISTNGCSPLCFMCTGAC